MGDAEIERLDAANVRKMVMSIGRAVFTVLLVVFLPAYCLFGAVQGAIRGVGWVIRDVTYAWSREVPRG